MKLSILVSFLMLLAGCRYQNELGTLNSLELDRAYLEQQVSSDLNQEKQEVINRYFSNIKDLAHRFNTDNRFSRNFHKRFYRYFSDDLCSRFVLSKKDWERVLDSCEVSGFFLCAEEARHYQEILKLVGANLTDLEVESLKEEAICNDRLVELGVFNENL